MQVLIKRKKIKTDRKEKKKVKILYNNSKYCLHIIRNGKKGNDYLVLIVEIPEKAKKQRIGKKRLISQYGLSQEGWKRQKRSCSITDNIHII